MSCPSCGWPTAEAEVISRHPTSEGTVRYVRCVCGRVTVQLRALTEAGARSTRHLSRELGTTSGSCRGK
jgi:hypothetical protein